MRLNLLLAVLLSPTAACAADPPPPAHASEVARQSRTITGQPLELPAGPVEMVVTVRELPPGGVVPMHRHRWQRYAYVEKGRIRMIVPETGLDRLSGPGEIIAEPRGQWHEGRVVGDEPVRLIVFEQVPPGQSNMELKAPD